MIEPVSALYTQQTRYDLRRAFWRARLMTVAQDSLDDFQGLAVFGFRGHGVCLSSIRRRHQFGTVAGFGSEQVAGFRLECMAGCIGIRKVGCSVQMEKILGHVVTPIEKPV
jgi:hypothetical protein